MEEGREGWREGKRERERDRQTDRQTDRQRGGERESERVPVNLLNIRASPHLVRLYDSGWSFLSGRHIDTSRV